MEDYLGALPTILGAGDPVRQVQQSDGSPGFGLWLFLAVIALINIGPIVWIYIRPKNRSKDST